MSATEPLGKNLLNMKIHLNIIKTDALEEIKKAENLKELNLIFKKYLGKRGKISLISHSLKELSTRKRKKVGKELNEVKKFLELKFNEKIQKLKKEIQRKREKEEWLDVTIPGKKIALGHLHPITQIKRELCEIFQGMGFEIAEGPDVESEWYNFDALNVPQDHPARDIHDTFLIKQKDREKLSSKEKLIMRSHTSPVQVHFMEKHNPPLRIIVPGRVFRHEATDPSHEFQFYHLEGLMVDKEISVANFKAIIQECFKKFFKKPIKIRLKPDYFPFTEPSFEVDISCIICDGKGCSACSQTGWLEVMGAGMVHPNVFKNSGLNPKEWRGFAFGMGLDRLAMLKYKIPDIRLFHSGDLRFLKQF